MLHNASWINGNSPPTEELAGCSCHGRSQFLTPLVHPQRQNSLGFPGVISSPLMSGQPVAFHAGQCGFWLSGRAAHKPGVGVLPPADTRAFPDEAPSSIRTCTTGNSVYVIENPPETYLPAFLAQSEYPLFFYFKIYIYC